MTTPPKPPKTEDPLSQINDALNLWVRQNVDPVVGPIQKSWDQSPFNPLPPPKAPVHHAPPGSKFTFLDAARPGEYNIPSWLLFVKTEGVNFGLGHFADQISLKVQHGQIVAHVEDPATLREISALRENPQLARKMEAAYTQGHHNMFPVVAYAGANTKPDPVLMQDQRALMTLGFDLGINRPDGIRGPLTDAALKEFAGTATPPIAPAAVHAQLQATVTEATAEAQKYVKTDGIANMTPAVVYSVHAASAASGMSYSYLMSVARRESQFKPDASPPDGGAHGLFQFERDTWLGELQRYGAKYGLGQLASKVTGPPGDHDIKDPATLKYALALRDNPRLNALLGAELQKENQAAVAAHDPALKNDPGALYVMHFLGGSTGPGFISNAKHNPDSPAAPTLPAGDIPGNRSVLFANNGHGAAYSFREVLQHVRESLSSHIFENPLGRARTLMAGNHHPPKPGTPS